MLKGTVFQGCLMHEGNKNKVIVLDVECGCCCRDGVAAYAYPSQHIPPLMTEVGGSLTVEAEGETEYLRINE